MSQPLSLSDRFFGAILGFQTALRMESQTISSIQSQAPQVAALLLRYDPLGGGQGAIEDSPVSPRSLWLGDEPWVEKILHQQLQNEPFSVAQRNELSSLTVPLDGAWLSLLQGQSWPLSFKLLTQHYLPNAKQRSPALEPSQPSETDGHSLLDPTRQRLASVAALGLWLGASQGPPGIPLHSLSLEAMTQAKVEAHRLYWTWAGHHRAEAVEV